MKVAPRLTIAAFGSQTERRRHRHETRSLIAKTTNPNTLAACRVWRTAVNATTRLRLRTACAIRLMPLLLLTLPATVLAQFSYGTNDGTITIIGYTGSGGAVTIPDTIHGLPVTSIGCSVFSLLRDLTSITMGNNITSIGDSAFLHCTGLINVTIPNSVTSIDRMAFTGCTGLTSLTIGNSVANIGGLAFWGCTGLTSVTIPNSVTSIGDSAFEGCTSLTSLTIGNSVTNIGGLAFWGCTGLTTVTIPSSVTSIGSRALSGCTSLVAILVDALNPSYASVDGVLFDKSQTTLTQCPAGRAGSYTIANGITGVETWAFQSCTRLTALDLKGNGLTNFTLPDGLTNLTRLDLSSNRLTHFTFPMGLTSLRELHLAHNPLATLGLPSELSSLTILDVRETPLTTLVLPEPMVAALIPPVETLRSQGTAVYVYSLQITTRYVSLESRTPVPPYPTWETAATNIQDAVDAAKAGDTVLVTNGVYAVGERDGNRVSIINSIRLRSVNGPVVTTIDGGGGVRCVYLGTDAVLSGFTLTNGASDNGGGVYCEASAVVNNCTVTQNSALNGGGVSGGTLYNCHLTSNWAHCIQKEGGLGGGAGSSTLYDCIVGGNYAYWSGGGVCAGTLYNCIVSGNSAMYGGGVDIGALYNCSITGNSAGYWGGGVFRGTLYNCIVYYNTAPNGGNYSTGVPDWAEPPLLQHSCTAPLTTNGIGNIIGPPLFMDMPAGDFRLQEGSPCVDAGTNLLGAVVMDAWGAPVLYAHDATDILGNTRFIDGNGDGIVAWDIGAHEFNSFKPPRFAVPPRLSVDGWKLNVTGAPDKWIHVQRSSSLKDWEEIWSGFIGSEGVQQVNDGDTRQKAMFYRVVVP